MALVTPLKRKQNRYTGEKKNELRHGHGIYRYPNKFFQYEGEWSNGEKHGHGKLMLGDTGYYEGTFVHGEIEGHGFKVFGLSGASYTGQFHQGELHGQGLLMKPHGEQYEGSWSHNSREGHGILTGSDGSSYEGEFHNNLKHGEGLQIYRNGDHYEGDWVAGKRHGHGMLRCIDGTLYDGQWRNDFYHGEGSISHASGVTYNGMWYNGQPASKTVFFKLVGDAGNKGILVEQGKPFTIKFECLDQDGVVCKKESGRSFKVSASKKKANTQKFRSKVVNALTRHNTITKSPTNGTSLPTSYAADQEYELLQIPPYDGSNNAPTIVSTALSHNSSGDPRQTLPTIESGVIVSEERVSQRSFTTIDLLQTDQSDNIEDSQARASPSLTNMKLHYEDKVEKKHSEEDILRAPSSASIEHISTSSLASPKKKKKMPVRDLNNSCETQSVIFPGEDDRKEFGSSDQRFLDVLVQPGVIVTTSGMGSCEDLFLPPAPLQDISHLLPGSKSADNDTQKGSARHTGSKSPTSSPRPKQKKSPSSPAIPPSPTQGRKKAAKMELQSSKVPPKAEKLLQPRRDKYCAPGQYFLTLTEVTYPPYFGEPIILNLEITVTPAKHEKEVSMDRLLKARASKDVSSDRLPGSKSRLSQLKS